VNGQYHLRFKRNLSVASTVCMTRKISVCRANPNGHPQGGRIDLTALRRTAGFASAGAFAIRPRWRLHIHR
jgi:hypothetical protein